MDAAVVLKLGKPLDVTNSKIRSRATTKLSFMSTRQRSSPSTSGWLAVRITPVHSKFPSSAVPTRSGISVMASGCSSVDVAHLMGR